MLLVLIWWLKDPPTIDSDSWEHIKAERANSSEEIEGRELQYLIIFQQAGLVMVVMLLPVGMMMHHNRTLLKKHQTSWKKTFENSSPASERVFETELLFQYPQLTTYDVKLCKMLLDGLSSKEIAVHLNISAASVNTARYRLRKKLNLKTNADLVKFLHRFL